MFQLPHDYPLEAFVGRHVVDVREGSHFVQITFESSNGEALVIFEGPIVLRSPRGGKTLMFSNQLQHHCAR